jgi:hypothetical protein
MEGGVYNTEHKVFIRERWNKPLIKFLSKKTGDKLVYMGLPSSSAEDLRQWIEFIKVVIAFQCRVYGKQSNQSQNRVEIEKLTELLRQLERERKIENYIVYDGYIEEIVVRGYDNSPRQIAFEQGQLVTLYNLDFCNDIASPLEFTDHNGDVKKAFKFNAIQKLLQIQESLSRVSDKFIFLLTVHCSYNGGELQNFVNNPPDDLVDSYFQKYRNLNGHEKNARIVRLFVCYQIQKYFPAYNFSHKILPVIKYNGINNTPLLHFVVIGTKAQFSANGVPTYQSINEVLDQKFISIDSDAFVNLESTVGETNITELDPINFFTRSKTYQNLWQ